jgi:hypothetical protein
LNKGHLENKYEVPTIPNTNDFKTLEINKLYMNIYILVWAEGIKGMMAEKGSQEEDWTDRNNHRLGTTGGRR